MSELILPGLIDPHVHLREPGATHKEDWASGTAAALAGGFTLVLDMPNNTPPIVDRTALELKQKAARSGARCDYGIHMGAGTDNPLTARQLADQTVGLKMYLDQTFGPLRLDNLESLTAHVCNWPADRPLLAHAEGRTMAAAILAAHLAHRPIHICHISKKEEIELIREAKSHGINVTCEVTPHHLFLTEADAPRLGAGRSEVRPRLATEADRQALLANLDIVDCFATDHAPHTLAEKDSENPPPGFPGLETALPLYLSLVLSGWMTLDGLIERTVHNPRRIFRLPEQSETWVEIDPEAEWHVRGSELQTRSKWSPFEGWKMRGRVRRVVLHGREVVRDHQVIAEPGSGRDIRGE